MKDNLLTRDEQQMIEDAPAEYFPRWLDVVADPSLRASLQLKYMQLRADHDDGSGIPAGRDMILRRIIYLDRIAQRLESARERVLQEVERRGVRGRGAKEHQQWHKILLQHEEAYERITTRMVSMLKTVGIEGAGRKGKIGRRKRRAFPVDGVVIDNE